MGLPKPSSREKLNVVCGKVPPAGQLGLRRRNRSGEVFASVKLFSWFSTALGTTRVGWPAEDEELR
jgi:hypothetical protein